MKIKLSNQTSVQSSTQRGMTLVEVLIALAIAGLTMGGIVSGYIFCVRSTERAEFAQVANEKAMERLEEARSAQWDVVYPQIDYLVATNFPVQPVILDLTGSGSSGTPATVTTTISQISVTPPLRRIRVDCVWQFMGGDPITTTVETIRAPDQ